MIPYRLRLRNFMCYREEQSLDFSGIHLACLAGDNGHGKSALLDAITWAIWGKARARRDDELIALGESEMWVELEFGLGRLRYRIWRQRSRKGRGQSDLHFYVWHEAENGWQPLDEGGLVERQAQIVRTLRMDYDTFVNSAFILQGKADSFTVKTPGERKQILGDILGLQRYDLYEERAKEEAAARKSQTERIQGELAAIERELSRRPLYEAQLQTARATVAAAGQTVRAAEAEQATIRAALQNAQEQARQLAELRSRLTRSQRDLAEGRQQLTAAQTRLAEYEGVLAQRDEIEAGWAALQGAREEDNGWNRRLLLHTGLQDQVAKARLAVNQGRLALENAIQRLGERREELARRVAYGESQGATLAQVQEILAGLADQQTRREAITGELQEIAAAVAALRNENDRLRVEGQALKDKIAMLGEGVAAACPLCGQPLTGQHRDEMLGTFGTERDDLSKRYYANQAEIKRLGERKTALEAEDANLARDLRAVSARQRQAAQAETAVNDGLAAAQEIDRVEEETTGLSARLAAKDYAGAEQATLAALEAQIAQAGYDSAAHQAVRARLESLQPFDVRYQRQLMAAVDGIEPVRAQVTSLQAQLDRREAELAEDQRRAQRLEEALKGLPALEADLARATQAVEKAVSDERRARQEEGAAMQQLSVLDALAERQGQLVVERDRLNEAISLYTQLREAFGKKGLQAMIIESAIPDIETEANRLLQRMSEGRMSLRLETQREKVTGGVAETLDIIISDEIGARPHEMFSVDGRERVYIRRNGIIHALPIRDLWDSELGAGTVDDGPPGDGVHRNDGYEMQVADYEALCYEDGRARWLPASHILRHPVPEKMLQVSFTPGNLTITLTPNHSIFVMTPDGLVARRVDELQPGDFALTPRSIPAHDMQSRIDLLDFIADSFQERRAANNQALRWDADRIWSRTDQALPRFVENDASLGEFLGLAVAEGSGKKALTISAGSDYKLAERAIALASQVFGINRTSVVEVSTEKLKRYVARAPGVSSETPQVQYRPLVGGRLVAHIVGNMIGQGAANKRVPHFIFNAPRPTQLAFLRGVLAGDGHVRIRPQQSQVEASITTISKGLAADLIFLCRQLGIWARVEKHGNAGLYRGMQEQDSYRISITGQANANSLLSEAVDLVKYTSATKFGGIPLKLLEIDRQDNGKRLKRDALDRRYPCGVGVVPARSRDQYCRMSRFLQDWNVVEVKEIREVTGTDEYVYDLVVPGNHSFVAGTGAILVHNSGGEAFRANLALRIAISKLLARRAGAQLQTLVIDEGFGTQDTQGRALLVEAINSIQHDFERIIVITHIEELKDLFPARIDVVKTAGGSHVSIA